MKKTNCLSWFDDMIDRCYTYAVAARKQGRPVVGITCEYTPRELIMAAGAVPVCLCGGAAEMIPPAERDLPANLCPLVKSTYGYHVTRENPFLEMADLIVGETTCDGKKKMYELMAESRPLYVLDLPQKENTRTGLDRWVAELRKLRGELERRFKVEITDAAIREGIVTMNRERALRRDLAALMQGDSPPLTGRQMLAARSIISGIPTFLRQYRRVISELSRTRVPDGRKTPGVRVMLTGVPLVHGAERVVEIIEEHGGLVVAMENCTGLKPILDDVDPQAKDPLRALAEKYYHLPCSVMTANRNRLDYLGRLAGQYRPQCVIELVWQNCLTYDVESFFIKRFAVSELGLPYLKIQTDYSPSDSARIALRVEALLETVGGRSVGRRASCDH